MSGRGLRLYSDGTVDKFESIPGFKMDYTIAEIENMIEKNNIVIASQSKELVPADKKIYELRDTIGCTNSKPLIVSSILSKKIASGANNIVIDITYGSGAFMKTKEEALELKTMMQEIGKRLGVSIKAVINFNGNTTSDIVFGNSLELIEAIEYLKGKENKELHNVIIAITVEFLGITKKEADEKIKNVIQNKKAYNEFEQLVLNQNGNLEEFFEKTKIENDKKQAAILKSDFDGIISKIDALKIAKVAFNLGVGRITKESEIDYFSGIEFLKKENEEIKKGDILARIYLGEYIKKDKSKNEIKNIIENSMKELAKCYKISKK